MTSIRKVIDVYSSNSSTYDVTDKLIFLHFVVSLDYESGERLKTFPADFLNNENNEVEVFQ